MNYYDNNEIVNELFATSVSHVMAHTIRGIETHIADDFNVNLRIRIRKTDQLTVACPSVVVKKISREYRTEYRTVPEYIFEIYVYHALRRNEARLRIMHELAHIIQMLRVHDGDAPVLPQSMQIHQQLNYYKRYIDAKGTGKIPEDLAEYAKNEDSADYIARQLFQHLHNLVYSKKLLQPKLHHIPQLEEAVPVPSFHELYALATRFDEDHIPTYLFHHRFTIDELYNKD
ncbi:MAG: hypothetical protein E7036_02110 [Opitutales bacterium]|nr:hypothetical protein [Opitutales bacterium]